VLNESIAHALEHVGRLVLGRKSAIAMHGAVRQKRFDLWFGGEEVRA
jgi:hypothetical protein